MGSRKKKHTSQTGKSTRERSRQTLGEDSLRGVMGEQDRGFLASRQVAPHVIHLASGETGPRGSDLLPQVLWGRGEVFKTSLTAISEVCETGAVEGGLREGLCNCWELQLMEQTGHEGL